MLLVNEIMNTDVATCSSRSSLEEVARMMWQQDCGVIPVVDDADEPVGIVTDRDIAMGSMLTHQAEWDLMVGDITDHREVYSCAPSDDVHDALKTMEQHRVRRLPVVDEAGHLAGILSMRDIINRAQKKRGAGLTYGDAVEALKEISR